MAQPSIRQINEAFEAAIVKNRLERELRAKYESWSRKVSRTFKENIQMNNLRITLTDTQTEELVNILDEHYKKTAQEFTTFDLNFESRQLGVVNMTRRQIKIRIENLINSRIGLQALEIVDTTEELMVLAINDARESLQEEMPGFTNRELATVASVIFDNRMRGRTIAITTTETTWPSEGARQINNRAVQDPLSNTLEAQEQVALVGGDQTELSRQAMELAEMSSAESAAEAAVISAGVAEGVMRASRLGRAAERVREMLKTWVTMGDAKVRASHRAANGQTVPDQEPFQIGNDLLMYPGDSSLGAGASEVVSCRCFSAYR